MTSNTISPVFDYRALRLLVGLIAFFLPLVVSIFASVDLSSISASYHTEARDIFVGMLFVVGAFLWAYNGHTPWQSRTSKIAAVSAILVALFPTSCDTCQTNIIAIIHYIAAALLFAILSYFCLGPFREKTKGQGGKKGRRAKVYFVCGWIIIICMVGLGLMQLILSEITLKALQVIYWAETFSLLSFGVAWAVAGKYFSFLVDEQDALHLFK